MRKPRNILLATSDNNLSSGAFNSCVFLAKNLIKKGFNVIVVLPCKGDGEKLLKDNKVPFTTIESEDWIVCNFDTEETKREKLRAIMAKNKKAYFEFRRFIKKNKIDIVHINTSYHFVAALAAIGGRAKVVWHLREFLEQDQDRHFLARKYALKLINHSRAIICISKAIYNKYKPELRNDKMHVVHNGIDIDKYYANNHNIFSKPNMNFLCVGGIWEKKGQYELCRALGRYMQKTRKKPNITLNLLGGYDDFAKKELEKILKKYKLNCVKLLGRKSNTPDYYKKADVVFMCSTSEAFGRVTVEGMLAGCLVVGKKCAGTVEILKNRKTGILYKDEDDLVAQIDYVIKHQEEMRKIAVSGQAHAKSHFSAELNCDNVIKVYKKL